MHYIKSPFRARAFRRASIIFIVAYLSLFVAAGTAIYTLSQHAEENLLTFSIVLGVSLLLWALALIISGSCRCQLCQASTMRSLKCSHHKKAKRLLGSYRLRIATAILFKGSFRCSYCGEAFSLLAQNPNKIQSNAPPRRTAPSRLAGQIPTKRR